MSIRNNTQATQRNGGSQWTSISRFSTVGRANNLGGYEALKFRGAKRDCLPCPQCGVCLRDSKKTETRQVAILSDVRNRRRQITWT